VDSDPADMAQDEEESKVATIARVLADEKTNAKMVFEGDEGAEAFDLYRAGLLAQALWEDDEASKLRLARKSLGATAMAMAVADGKRPDTLQELLDTLASNLGSKTTDQYRDEFDLIKHRVNQPWEEFISRFSKLRLLAGVTDDKEAGRVFRRALLNDMVLAIASTETSFKKMLPIANLVAPTVKQKIEREERQKQGRSNGGRGRGGRGRGGANRSVTGRAPRRCWNCDQEGHIAVNCDQPQEGPRKGQLRITAAGEPGVQHDQSGNVDGLN
jgi:hypothetical protein